MTVRDRSAQSKNRKGAGAVEVLVAEIAMGRTIARAAEKAGMSEPTARRRLKEPAVQEMLTELRVTTLTSAADRLAQLTAGAALELGRIIASPTTSDSVKVRAIGIAIREGLRLRSDILTEQRLAAIEQHLEVERVVREAQQQRLRLAYSGAR